MNGDNPLPNPREKDIFWETSDFMANKDIFLKTQRAENALTFEGAQVILNQINKDRITDSELASYVAMGKEIADFAAEVGISRKAGLDFSSIMENTDLVALAKNAIIHPLDTLQKAYKIKNDLPTFENLDEILSDRYGSD